MSAEARLNEAQFSKLALFIESNYGIKMPAEKRTMVQARLVRRLQSLGLRDFEAYLDLLFNGAQAREEVLKMTDLVSTHKTSFFREPSHYDILRRELLPQLVSGKHFTRNAPFLVWSAASSTGEEAYSLAMVLEEFRRARSAAAPAFEYAVLGTDISHGVLETARRAIYSREQCREVPGEYFKRYFLVAKDKGRHECRVAPEIRRRVFFHPLNLMDPAYEIQHAVHLVFCRNVLIYFNRQRQEEVANKLLDCLVDDGYLVLGHSETLVNMNLPVKVTAPTVYRKVPNQDRGDGKQ